MKKIYSLLFIALFLFLGYSCDDGSLDHSDVYIPDPVEENFEDDGIAPEPTTTAVIKMKIGEENKHQVIDGFGCAFCGAIGNIVGTIAGAAIGNALTAPKPDPIEEYAYVPEVRQGQSHSKFKPRTQTQQQLTQLKLRKIRFIDDNRNHAIDGGESSKIIFEIMNEGRNPVYDVVPIVETVGKVKHIGISPTVMIEEILPGEGIRYTATVYAGSKLKDGEVTFRVAVSDENGVICDSQEL